MTTLYTSNVIQALLGITGRGSPRNDEYANAVQFIMKSPAMFWVTKKAWMRNIPITVFQPTRRQAEWWLTFATTMNGLKNQYKGNTPTPLPQDSYRYIKTHGRSGHAAGDKVLPIQAAAQKALKGKANSLASPHETKAKKLWTLDALREYIGQAPQTAQTK
jgi:hypothetical protein